ncbi:hypothetical protein CEXT_640931 [Caerostris extrusa]|uniref:Uncharacterized protein n=1 Tax=Caerostris extrusa TaxID=172846 RepID=A0AAV4MV00_CAEEX|nr:hypothetical protein CEXT_640931 [Caerostris extrusa]
MRLGEEQKQSESLSKAPEVLKGNKEIVMLIEGLIYHQDKVSGETINQLLLLILDSWSKLYTLWNRQCEYFLNYPPHSYKVKMPDESHLGVIGEGLEGEVSKHKRERFRYQTRGAIALLWKLSGPDKQTKAICSAFEWDGSTSSAPDRTDSDLELRNECFREKARWMAAF